MVGLVVGCHGIVRVMLRVGVLSLSSRPHVPARCVQGAGLRPNSLLVIRVREGVWAWLELPS